MHNIIACKLIAQNLKQQLASKIEINKNIKNKIPKLTAIIVGDDPASKVYVRNKEKACNVVGIESNVIKLPSNSTTEEVIKAIKLSDSSDGIIVQRPLPAQIDADLIALSISPCKDVDGFNPTNLGNLYLNPSKCLNIPATPKGVITILKESQVNLVGANVVVLGRSATVGLPLSTLLTFENCNVTTLHSRTPKEERQKYCLNADIIISAVGKKESLNIDSINKNKKVTIIDVGINRDDSGYLCGDVNPEVYSLPNVIYTPVPGGVGPMTIVSLLDNTCKAFERNNNIKI